MFWEFPPSPSHVKVDGEIGCDRQREAASEEEEEEQGLTLKQPEACLGCGLKKRAGSKSGRKAIFDIMLILLAGIFGIHIIGIIILLVATIDNVWWMTDVISTDVWARWIETNGCGTSQIFPQVHTTHRAVQASSVLACIFSIIGIFVFVAQLFTLEKGQRFTISGAFQLLACLCIMIAAAIYTDRFHLDEKNGWYGHCFILAWIAFSLTFISSIIYFVFS
ncbi:hypothetical protein F7725_003870 [Dissostichus mawsoni]|uniref:Epithelial membrane protein 1 n=1 Tax=Dissostichus mawsoni TaxID=36200 RepID=A0A7J5YBF1_DISMA|nr:hypothetical protein F7725_003870 [Dissostichus mawsoni]